MSKLDRFMMDTGQPDVDQVLSEIEAEESDDRHCEVETCCHELLGVNGGRKKPYTCGFRLADTVHSCPRRKRLMAQFEGIKDAQIYELE